MSVAFGLSRSLAISSTNNSNIIRVSISDNTPERAVDILNSMISLYNRVLNNEKAKTFSQAISFVEQRLGPLGRELDSMEGSLANYKERKGLVGESANGELYLSQIREVDNQLNNINIQKATLEAVEAFIKNPGTSDANLSIVGITDFTLQNNISQFQQLRREKEKLALVVTETNPNLVYLENSMIELKQTITNQLAQLKRNISYAESTYQTQLMQAKSLLQATPEAERELLSRMRFRNIKESLFLTLLQKKEEAGLARASISVDTKVLTPLYKYLRLPNLQYPLFILLDYWQVCSCHLWWHCCSNSPTTKSYLPSNWNRSQICRSLAK